MYTELLDADDCQQLKQTLKGVAARNFSADPVSGHI